MVSTRWRLRRPRRRDTRLLGVLLCYNDGDFLAEAIQHLVENGHHVIAWDHGSDDETPEILDRLRDDLLEVKTIPREFDFYQIYPEMSRHLMENYVSKYDWISWPDQDEILEGPDRSRSYREWLEEVAASPYDWIQFNNFNYWWTTDDDASIAATSDRVRHYSLFADCSPRIRSWRSSATNERHFNHNEPEGVRYPQLFNLRHYPMRSREQMARRLDHDRANLERNGYNFHYDNMSRRRSRLIISAESLHFDDGGELDHALTVNWRELYGTKSLDDARDGP
jgi:glycosyltransferase involved in cell wall biosynthesis